MMNNNEPTIIQRIQPQCDALPRRMKDAKNAQHKTNQSVADSTGLPISTVAKFFSGTLSNPGVFGVAAMCIDLDLSLDNLMGIAPELPEADTAHILELEAKLEGAEAQIALLKDSNRIMERGIIERDHQIAETRRIWKPMIYGLCALCIMLASVMMTYIVMDAQRPDIGLIRGLQNTSPIVWVGISALVMFALLTTHTVVSRWYRKTKRNGENEGNR